ncbi:MAG: hypothetical protein HYS06_05710 [Methylocystis sp.]|nr:hypothetical protein [Methylocystis sp.]MBI3274864.1 hypothetical protein [Methylocystis sp.]
MAQHEHDPPTQPSGADETTGAGKRAPDATPSDGGARSEDAAIFRSDEEEANRLEHDRVTSEASENSLEHRDIAGEAGAPDVAPRRRKTNRQTLTLVLSAVGLAATVAAVGAFYLRDKDERLRAFSVFIEKAVTHPETLFAALKEDMPKWLGGAGETSVPTKTKPALDGSVRPAPAPDAQSAVGKAATGDEAEALGKRVDELERIARSALAVAVDAQSSADKSVSARIDELDSEIRAVREKLDAPKGETRLPQEQPEGGMDKNSAAAIVAVTQSLIQAVDRGRPFAAEYGALAALGADPGQLAGLEPSANAGAPTARQLLDAFAPVAKRLRAMDAPAPDAPYADHFLQGVGRLVKIRPPGAAATDGVSDIVARIEAALGHGEIAAAADAFAKLPDSAETTARDWGDMLRRRRDVEKAADSILSGAIGALGRTKG